MVLCAYYPFLHWLFNFTKILPVYRTLVFPNFRQCLDNVSHLFEVLIHSFKACKNFISVAITEFEMWQSIFHYEIAHSSLVTIAHLTNNGILHAIDRLLVNRFQKLFFWRASLDAYFRNINTFKIISKKNFSYFVRYLDHCAMRAREWHGDGTKRSRSMRAILRHSLWSG